MRQKIVLILSKNEFVKDDQVGEDEEGEGIVLAGGSRYAWEGSDRDYTYDEVFVPFWLLTMYKLP